MSYRLQKNYALILLTSRDTLQAQRRGVALDVQGGKKVALLSASVEKRNRLPCCYQAWLMVYHPPPAYQGGSARLHKR